MSSFITSLISALAAALKMFGAAVDYFKTKETFESGKKVQEAEIIIANEKIQREQTEILLQDRPKSEVVKKTEDGTF
jgi:hypothetical protein